MNKTMNDSKLWKLWVFPLSALGLFTIAVGLLAYLVDIGPNKCQMTYMFEYPIYTRLRLPAATADRFPQYRLYAYSEGAYTDQVRRNVFVGIPVLFLPGNGGSYRQVRSLGSVSLRKSEDVRSRIRFDYFSVDFNEELSGLAGALLEKQTQFAVRAIDHVLSFYQADGGRKIVLVGHSMGGIVARAVLSRGYGDRIDLIYTQATPHLAPPMAIDRDIVAFYRHMREAESEMKRFDTPIVSVSGGRRDVIVPNHLTSLEDVEVSRGSLSVSTTSIPLVWASTDHLCVVWCKQLVLATVRSMFQLVDDNNNNNKELIADAGKRASILYHHFLAPERESRAVDDVAADVVSDALTSPNWHFHADRVSERRFFRSPIKDLKSRGDLLTIVGNFFNAAAKDDDSVLLCASATSGCRTATAGLQRLEERVGAISLNLTGEPDEGVVALRIPVSKKSAVDAALSVAPADRIKYSSDKTLSRMDFTFDAAANAMHVDLSSLESAFFLVKTLEIEPESPEACRISKSDRRVFARLWVPWANDDVYYVFDCGSEAGAAAEEMVLALETPKPMGVSTDRRPVLSLFKTNEQAFRISVSTSIFRSVGHYFRFNGVGLILYGYLSTWILYFAFTLLSVDISEASNSWLVALGYTFSCGWIKVFIFGIVYAFPRPTSKTSPLGLAVYLLEELTDAKDVLESLRLYHRGLWTVATPFLNFAISMPGVVVLLFLFDKLTALMKKGLDFVIRVSTLNGFIHAVLYSSWSLCLVASPLLNVSCSHLMCLLWLVARKRPQAADPLRLDTVVFLQRFLLFGLSLPSLIVFAKNVIETRGHYGYFTEEIVRNANTEHTCLGLLMWTVLHFNPPGTNFSSHDVFQLGTLSLFSLLVITTEYSFHNCILLDLSTWLISGCLTIFHHCFHFDKRKME